MREFFVTQNVRLETLNIHPTMHLASYLSKNTATYSIRGETWMFVGLNIFIPCLWRSHRPGARVRVCSLLKRMAQSMMYHRDTACHKSKLNQAKFFFVLIFVHGTDSTDGFNGRARDGNSQFCLNGKPQDPDCLTWLRADRRVLHAHPPPLVDASS